MNKSILYSKANETCCPQYEIVINDGCENLVDIGNKPVPIFNGHDTYLSFTLLIDKNITTAAKVTVMDKNIPETFVIRPGTSVTRVYRHASNIYISALDTGETITGVFCFKIYTQITL